MNQPQKSENSPKPWKIPDQKPSSSEKASRTDEKKAKPEGTAKKCAARRLSRKMRRDMMKQYRRGIVTEEDLHRYGIDCNGFDFQYSQFRLGGLSRIESWYNAVFLYALHRFDQSEKHVPRELKNTFSHPKGWYRDSFFTWRNNFWSHMLALLQRIPKIQLAVRDYFKALPEKLRQGHHHRTVRMDNSFRVFVNFCRSLKSAGKILLPICCAGLFGFFAYKQLDYNIALDVFVNGEPIGAVSNGDVLVNAQRMLEKNLSDSAGDTFRFSDDITYHFSHEKSPSYLSESDVYSALYAAAKQHIRPGYGLYIDGALIVASENQGALEKAVEDIKEYYKTRTAFYAQGEDIQVRYANDISIIPKDFPIESLADETTVRKTLGLAPIADRPNPKDAIYTLYYDTIKSRTESRFAEFSRNNLTGIAAFGNLSEETGVNPSSSSGISGTQVDVTLDYVITRRELVYEPYAYDTEYVDSEDYRQGLRHVAVEGKDGYRRATYEVSYQGGVEIGRTLADEEILTPAQNCVVYVGTRVPTEEELATMATGTFIMPYNNYLSSSYGLRTISDFGTRDFHPAWDIPGSYGADIAAADGGVVTSVGYTSGYGLHVIIDHENGYETLYAHLSKATVSEGDRVAQGDTIAKMGSSGRVTGVHVHFEIRKDGVTVDPATFLGEVEEKY